MSFDKEVLDWSKHEFCEKWLSVILHWRG
jgi:hypothetical protein